MDMGCTFMSLAQRTKRIWIPTQPSTALEKLNPRKATFIGYFNLFSSPHWILTHFLGVVRTWNSNCRNFHCLESSRKRGPGNPSSRSSTLFSLCNCLTHEPSKVVEHSHQLRQNAQVIDELDVAVSFSRLAYEMKFVRPEIRDE